MAVGSLALGGLGHAFGAAAAVAGPVSPAPRLMVAASPHGTAAVARATIYVDPVRGKDTRRGTRKAPLRSLDAAWRMAKTNTTIRIAKGRVKVGATYYESKQGVRIIGAGMAATTIPPLNVYGVKDFTLQALTVDGDTHCEACDGFTVDQVRIQGKRRVGDVLKINQSSRVSIRSSDISGGTDNAIDMVAVQHADVTGNRIHDADDWCEYAKGGSAYVRVWNNEISQCGTGGFTAGQGTGFQFMVAPWLQYEAYDVKAWNNRIHDTEGAGLGANGAYDTLFAHNTLLNVGSRGQALEAVFGLRSCDGQPGDDGRDRCDRYLAAGGWGTSRVDDGTNAVRIPNRHVWFYDNVIVKAPGMDTISIAGPFDDAAQDGSNVPRPALADDDLQQVGNVVTEGAAAGGPGHDIPPFTWDDPRTPAPASLDNAALTGIPAGAPAGAVG